MACTRFVSFLTGLVMVLGLPSGASGQSTLLPRSAEPNPVTMRVFLVGDAGGADSTGSTPALDALRRELAESGMASHVIFLGDNIYCCGLPDSSSHDRKRAEERLVAQLDVANHASGRIVFIPGNHDWGKSGHYDPATVRRQEQFVESWLDRGNTFLPDDALPGPHEISLGDGVCVVAVDTQWWLMDAPRPTGESDDYDVREPVDLLLALQDLLVRRDDELVLLIAHHPLQSMGRHGGRYPALDHVFPLTQLHRKAWIPLPGLGSLYPLLRNLIGAEQDVSNRTFQQFAHPVSSMLQNHPGRVIYAAGHEHGLQHTVLGETAHLLVSGAGSRPDWLASGEPSSFSYGAGYGFLVLDIHEDRSVHLYAVASDRDGNDVKVRYEANLFPPEREVQEGSPPSSAPVLPDSAIGAVDAGLLAGPLKRRVLGEHHRMAWATPVRAPVFHLAEVEGGLEPIRRGGGLQTTSLRLVNNRGHEFVLRSLTKDAAKTIPEPFRETLAEAIFADQTSAIFPYGALLVPPLARAAGIHHAEPVLYHVPRDDRFGRFRDLVAGQPMLFEARPDDDMSHAPEFGNAPDVDSASKMYRQLREDNDHRVHASMFARARLLDMYVSDWDRHVDQWRWAAFDDPDGRGIRYEPIPRDRDWAFNRMNGVLPSILKSQLVLPKFQDFRPGFGFIPGLNQNGMVQDRRLTAGLDRQAWTDEADSLTNALTDGVIDDAVARIPPELGSDYRDFIRSGLHGRRTQLVAVAETYYELLADLVDVVGSDKHERFVVSSYGDSVRVTMYKTGKDGDVRQGLFDRTFLPAETSEIRLYGLDGNDVFIFNGRAPSSIRVFAVGGAGTDRFVDESVPHGRRHSFFIYDSPEGSSLIGGPATSDERSSNPRLNLYDPTEFWFEPVLPSAFFGHNLDDGVFLGGGLTRTTHRFRRYPYDTHQTFRANIAFRTGAVNVAYGGHFTERLGRWGLGLDAEVRTPDSEINFYGFGNETSADALTSYAQSQVRGAVRATIPSRGPFTAWIGPVVDRIGDEMFAGVATGLTADYRDREMEPGRGFLWESGLSGRSGFSDTRSTFVTMRSTLTLYTPVGRTGRHVVAVRAGAQHITGPFPYFFASTVGGAQTVRGFRKGRFAGRTAAWNSIEIRSRVFRYATPIAAGHGGILLFVDNGRVWADRERSSRWHTSLGAGAWINIFDLALLQSSFERSPEETTVSIGFGFDL
jgi:hypothetical protein